MNPRRILAPSNWIRWLREIGDIAAARRHTTGFIATSSTEGLIYTPLPERVWGTKSFDFWAFLLAMLQRFQPESLLEIGSGRSTVYLGEYASKRRKTFISLENSRSWSGLGNAMARFGNIREDYIACIPLASDGFYADPPLRDVLPSDPELVYLDGPNGPRNGTRQIALYRELAQCARIVVLDDIHRATIYPQVDLFMTAGRRRDVIYFRYPASRRFDNYVAVLFDSEMRGDIDAIVRVLGIEVLHSVTERICVD